MRLFAALSFCLPLVLLSASCHPQRPAEQPSHIRVEPSTPADASSPAEPATGAVTPKELGIDFYPGAKVVTSTFVRDDAGITGAVKLETRDRYDDVANHYRKSYQRRDTKVVDLSSGEGKALALNWQTAHGNFTVTIKQDLSARRTLIHLVRTPGVRHSTGKPRP